jgi:hypothetical protein
MVKTAANPNGVPIEVLDGIRAAVASNRPQFFKDFTLPFYGFNRPGAKISEGIREHWWQQGMMGSVQAHYDGIKAFSETDFTEDPHSSRADAAVELQEAAEASCRRVQLGCKIFKKALKPSIANRCDRRK